MASSTPSSSCNKVPDVGMPTGSRNGSPRPYSTVQTRMSPCRYPFINRSWHLQALERTHPQISLSHRRVTTERGEVLVRDDRRDERREECATPAAYVGPWGRPPQSSALASVEAPCDLALRPEGLIADSNRLSPSLCVPRKEPFGGEAATSRDTQASSSSSILASALGDGHVRLRDFSTTHRSIPSCPHDFTSWVADNSTEVHPGASAELKSWLVARRPLPAANG
jgi:hypothetical protein